MEASKRNAWRRIAFALALACLFGIVVYATLMGLSTAAADNATQRGNEGPPTMLSDGTGVYTTFLPIVFKNLCLYESTRPPLRDTGNFPGEVEILTPPNCTTGIPPETAVLASGTYTGTPNDVIIWVLAYAPTGLYYPQSPNACAGVPPFQSLGIWQVQAYFGEKGGPPEWFDLVVVLTDQRLSDFLSDWVQEGCWRGIYWGIPAAVLEKMNITEKGFICVQTTD